eukprot:CAMPEP_0206273648 /NCGR_PEP_ID=MMETSP0047_2-20121206/34715_1 /ASSEMBLY_ACC=CAM_ASM_000192 /TAXON_ID=195065 /ORGANISM="Chroomonas mesostigmatica_cf, Strain CCMP1168" /LENGTH=116 /DNA_ID=CAMNT_0053702773 /DNA_START=361 /DNA_END=711 /DNA_ORIENTATION=-
MKDVYTRTRVALWCCAEAAVEKTKPQHGSHPASSRVQRRAPVNAQVNALQALVRARVNAHVNALNAHVNALNAHVNTLNAQANALQALVNALVHALGAVQTRMASSLGIKAFPSVR